MNRHFLLTISIVTAVTLSAQDLSEFNSAVLGITANNLQVKIDSLSQDSQIASMKSANTLSDPEIEVSHLRGMHGIGSKTGVDVKQSFDWPSVYSARKNHIEAQRSINNLALRSKYLETATEVGNTLIEFIYTKRKLNLCKEINTYVDSLYYAYKKGVDSGQISILDLNKVAIERISCTRNFNEVRDRLNNLTSKLCALNGYIPIGDMLQSVSDYPEWQIKSLDDYLYEVRLNNPNLKYGEKAIDAIKHEKKVLNASRFPSLSIGYSFEREMDEYFNGVSIGMTLPIYSRKHQNESLTIRELQIQTQNQDLIGREENDIRRTYTDLTNNLSEIEEYEPIVMSVNNFLLLRKAFQGGQISLLEYLADIKYFLEARIKYEDTLFQYNMNAFMLNRLSLIL